MNLLIGNRKSYGGGGEPLKNKYGENITNLKKLSNNNNNDNVSIPGLESHYNSINNKLRERNRDKSPPSSPINSNYNRRNNRNIDEREIVDNEINVNNSKNRNRNSDYNENKRDINKDYDNEDDGNNNNGSPRKFMSALRDMNSGLDQRERESRLKKERDYQESLRKQIEDNKRKKEQEKERLLQEKRLELQEYYQDHYKGEIPKHVLEKISPQKPSYSNNRNVSYDDDDRNNNDDKYNNNDYQYNKQSKSSNNNRNHRESRQYNDEDDNESDRRNNSKFRNQPQVVINNNLSDDDDANYNYNNKPTSNKDKPKKQLIDKADYDDLSMLCDQLLKQQNDLKFEVKKQAKMIEDLRLERMSNNNNTLIRSKSVQQTRKPIDTKNRPNSSVNSNNNNYNNKPAINKPVKATKVAFGGNINTSRFQLKEKEKEREKEKETNKPNKNNNYINNNVNNISNSRNNNKYSNNDSISPVNNKSNKNLNNGLLNINGYNSNASNNSNSNYNKRLSSKEIDELNGASEYLQINESEVDMISNDQLDRLLTKARNNRR